MQFKAVASSSKELNNLVKTYETAANFYRQGDYAKSMNLTHEIILKSNKSKYFLLTSKTISLQAKIFYIQKNKNAKSRFELSNSILVKNDITDKPLMLENYSYLKLIANLSGNASLVKKFDDKILQLKGNIVNGKEVNTLIELDKEKAAKIKLQLLTNEMQEELTLNASKLDLLTQDQLKSKLIMEAQENQILYVEYSDSLNSERLKIQELSISDANSRRNIFAIGFAFMALLLGGSLYLYSKLKMNSTLLLEKNIIIEIERDKSESLLLNILPVHIVDELKENGFSKAQNYNKVCVGFLDFVSFSKISEQNDPQIVLDDLNTCFKAFDEIITKYQLEKIKTIGDCYMYAGGLSESNEGDNIDKMVRASKEMIFWLYDWNLTRAKNMLITYQARVGLHSGPVAAGVVGIKKFLYDIWGDTVNIAARMEQNSEANRINVSELIFQSVKHNHKCEYRGGIDAKNKGLMKMYFIC